MLRYGIAGHYAKHLVSSAVKSFSVGFKASLEKEGKARFLEGDEAENMSRNSGTGH
jgi:hypothetical protein